MTQLIKKLQKNSIPQHSKEWYNKRLTMITASDCGTILGYNKYSNIDNLLNNKKNNIKIDNEYTKHGNYYEPIAIKIFEKKHNLKVYPIGLLIHKKYPYIGASPDGILVNNKILEIKCPLKRKINGNISLNYYAQVQLQLEVTNIDKAYFYECEFKEYDNKNSCNSYFSGFNKNNGKYWNLENDNLLIIERNTKWFNDNISKFISFYSKLNNKKRKIINQDNIINKKRKIINKDWLHINKIRNYLLNDCLSDWLNLYGEENGFIKNESIFTNYIYEKSYFFKNKIYSIIQNKYHNIVKTVPYFNKYIEDLENITINYMKNGIPIIINGMLSDIDNKTYINTNFLIRNDYMYKIFGHKYKLNNIKSKFGNYYYVIVEIKYLRLKFTSNNKYLLNTNKIKLAKSLAGFQLSILNKKQLSNNYIIPNNVYIIGNGYSYKFKKIEYKNDDYFDKLGIIYLDSYDDFYFNNYNQALIWYRNLQNQGHTWKIFPKPSINELYPFISSNNINNWENAKIDIAKKLGELSLLWNIGIKHRNLAHKIGIYSFHDNKILDNLENIGFKKNSKKYNILKKIIQINNTNTKIIPNYIINNNYNWKNNNLIEFYVDFETINYSIANISMIYLIGLLIYNPNEKLEKNKLQFYTFYANKLNENEEKLIINKWIKTMQNIKNEYKINYEPNIYTWSSAENNFFNNAKLRHKKNNWNIKFTDFMQIFKNEPIIINGCLSGFGLKDIALKLYEFNLIKTKYNTNCTSGDISMIMALNYYNNYNKDDLNDIINYNYIDCFIIYEIVNCFRNNFIK